MNTEVYEEILRQTLEDRQLTTSERKALRDRLAEPGLNEPQRAQLRSMAFRMAREAAGVDGARAIGWLEEINKLLLPPPEREDAYATAAFSPGDDCVNVILGQIRAARVTADICVFTVTDNRITAALREAHRRGVALRIITDNDKMLDEGSDIEELASAGVPVRVDFTEYHMHHKFAIFDGRTLLTGSYNWTRGAAAYNEEHLVVTNDRGLVRAFAEKFEGLWRNLEA
jgi:phosphatidylserine/phosphatidylglycerophosphate/cardiolipin synthase-like enzyme